MRSITLQRLYDEEMPWLDCEGNDAIITAKCEQPITLARLSRAAYLLRDSVLALAPRWLNTWREFLDKHPHIDAGIANQWQAFEHISQGALPVLEDFEDVMNRVPCPLGYSQKYYDDRQARFEQEQDRIERSRLIAEIAQGQSVYSWRDKFGVVKREQCSHLENETTDRLREIHQFVREQRRLLAMNPVEFNQERLRARKQQEAAARVIPQITLVNPDTNQEYTRAEMVRLIAAKGKEALRGLLFDSQRVPIPGAAQALDRILGVKPQEQPGQRFGVKV
jgi:hypothetical protein